MVAAVRREVQGVLLVLIGGALLRLSISGAYKNYVKPGIGPYLTAVGVVLALLGLWGVLRDDTLPRHRAPAAAAHTEEMARPDNIDGHRNAGSRLAWLLLLPVLTIFLVAPPPLGAFAAGRGTTSVPPPADALPALIGDPADLDVVEFVVRAIWDDEETLKGHRVRMTGFVTKAPVGGWYLTRLMISCCAADAQPFMIKTVAAPSFPADTWVQLVGEWVPGGGTHRSDAIPLIKVESVVTVPQPANPYE
jgi:uncharacterized repeat protein (TIGR03943 family)